MVCRGCGDVIAVRRLEWKSPRLIAGGRYDVSSRYGEGAWLVMPARGPSAQTKTTRPLFGVLTTIPVEGFVSRGGNIPFEGAEILAWFGYMINNIKNRV